MTSPPILAARGVSRRFAGLTAVDAVDLELQIAQLHALIGTNGAGKSTLVNILAGELAPSAGGVMLEGRDITSWSQPRRARAGIARTYQRTTIFPEFSVFENCRLAAQACDQRPWSLSPAVRARAAGERADEALARTGLTEVADRIAGTLPHGGKRQLEVALCLVAAPRVLLLDEPLAGMGAEETERMLALVMSLKPHHAILMVEHDMDAVFRVADRITVLVNGGVLASDSPAVVRADPQVRAAYLGEDDFT